MSRPYPTRQIVRCPLCHDGRTPQHIGHGVILCESCGAMYRVVHATKGNTGARLGEYVKQAVSFAPQKGGPR